LELLTQAYEYGAEAVRRARREDKRHAAITAANIGGTAEKLWKLTRDKALRDKAITDYATFRNYFTENRDSDLFSFFVRVDRGLQELQGLRDKGKDFIRERRKRSLSKRILTLRDLRSP
jgi:hypothetical protein